jgi:subtilase family serine protease
LDTTEPNEQLNPTIFLVLQNTGALSALLTNPQDPSSPQFHQWLKAHEFRKAYYPTKVQIANLVEWLGQQGFTVTPPFLFKS